METTAVIERLFEYLKEQRIRDSEIAEILGITRSNPGQWRKGISIPTLKNFIAILNNFPELNVEWLFRGENSTQHINNNGTFSQQTNGKKNTIVNVAESQPANRCNNPK